MTKYSATWRGMKEILDPDQMEEMAREVGYVRRQRKIEGSAFVCALMFGHGHADHRRIEDCRRYYESVTGVCVTSSAFQKRFTRLATEFVKRCYAAMRENFRRSARGRLPENVRRFADVKSIDSTAMTLADELEKLYAGLGKKGSRAMAKFTGMMSLARQGFERGELHAYRDRKREWPTLRKEEIFGCLVLVDLGLFCWRKFQRLLDRGAHFVTRLKNNHTPHVVEVLAGTGGARTLRQPTRLRDMKLGKNYDVIVSVKVGKKQSCRFRVLGVEHAGQTHEYVTDLSARDFTPAEVAELYRLRWQIEILFKESKSLLRLDHLSSRRREVIETQIWASLLAHLLVRCLSAMAARTEKIAYEKISMWKSTSIILDQRERLVSALVKRDRDGVVEIVRRLLFLIAHDALRAPRKRRRIALPLNRLSA